MSIGLKNLIITPLLIISINALSQVTKFKTTSFSIKSKNEYTEKWTKWSEAEDVEILITFDLTNERIKIFSKEEQEYDIIKYFDKKIDEDGDETIKLQCVNEDGLKCIVRIVVLNSNYGQRQLYIDFADIMWVYDINKLE